jgi:hypothetical protein
MSLFFQRQPGCLLLGGSVIILMKQNVGRASLPPILTLDKATIRYINTR